MSYGRWVKAYWNLNKAVAGGAAKTGADAARRIDIYRRGRGARRGILGPGDPAPPASSGGSWYDYRGVLALRRVPPWLQQGAFPLGRYVHPTAGTGEPIGLGGGVMEHNVAIIGQAGSGKTRSLIVPWILAGLRAGYSVVALDVKGDLLDSVKAEARLQAQPVGVKTMSLDYTRPGRSIGWNWLAEIDSDRAIDNVVQSIVGKQAPPGTDPYFFNLDSQILRGLLELVLASPNRAAMTASAVLRILRDQKYLERVLARTTSASAALRLRDLTNLAPDDFARRTTGIAVRLDALARSSLEAVTNHSDIRAQDILDSRHFVSVVAPVQDGQMAQMLSSLFVNQLLFRAYNRFGNLTGVPLLLVLDEAAQLSDRVDFENVLSVARAAGVSVVFALQDVAHFKDENERSIVFANCGTLICFGGSSPTSAKLLSSRLGDHPVQTSSVSEGPSSGWSTSTNTSTGTQMAPVLGLREIMSPPFGDRIATVHARDVSDRPFLVDLHRSDFE